MLPSRYVIDYEALLSAARAESGTNIALFLQERLPVVWRDVYGATVAHPANLVRLRFRTFEYICDEKELLLRALEKFGWNQTQAAKYLNISRKRLIYRMEKFGLPPAAEPQDTPKSS